MIKFDKERPACKNNIPISETIIKLLLSIVLISCIFRFPYGYYQLVRVIASITFLYLGIYEKEKAKEWRKYLFIALALLFQPLFKISLGRDIWILVDVTLAILLWGDLVARSKWGRIILKRNSQ